MRELISKTLVAESKNNAYYSLRLLVLDEGFVLESCHGSYGRQAGRECYWRATIDQAQHLYDKIMRQKTRPGRLRVYSEIEDRDGHQMQLFPESLNFKLNEVIDVVHNR